MSISFEGTDGWAVSFPIRPYQADMYIRCRPERLAILRKLVRPSSSGVFLAPEFDKVQKLSHQEALTKLIARDFLGFASAYRSKQLVIVRNEVGFDLTTIIGILAAVIPA